MANPKRTRPRAPDVNQNAFRIMQEATADPDEEDVQPAPKNPAAVALGLMGGSKGGKARAANLTQEERSASARKAAAARWQKDNR
jgi:hypothetical protein